MGYTTSFEGFFQLDRALMPEHREYLGKFAYTRRMKRLPRLAEYLPDPVRQAVGLPIGEEGGYYVGSTESFGQGDDESIADYNSPPSGQPGLWCQWTPNPEGTAIYWDGGEKFYYYVEWLGYLIEHFLTPWGYVVNGQVKWQGEDSSDFGIIVVKKNVVSVARGSRTYDGPERVPQEKVDRALESALLPSEQLKLAVAHLLAAKALLGHLSADELVNFHEALKDLSHVTTDAIIEKA